MKQRIYIFMREWAHRDGESEVKLVIYKFYIF